VNEPPEGITERASAPFIITLLGFTVWLVTASVHSPLIFGGVGIGVAIRSLKSSGPSLSRVLGLLVTVILFALGVLVLLLTMGIGWGDTMAI